MRDSKLAPLSYKSELLQLQPTSVLFEMDKLTNGMSECRLISCVSLPVHVGEEDRSATAKPKSTGLSIIYNTVNRSKLITPY
jgi:hypothetical protein